PAGPEEAAGLSGGPESGARGPRSRAARGGRKRPHFVGRRARNRRGVSGDRRLAGRANLDSQTGVASVCPGCIWRLCVNSTLKSLLFWTVLFVIGVLIWNVSTKFQRPERRVSFSEFMSWVDSGSVARVEIVGQDITGVTKANEQFHAY